MDLGGSQNDHLSLVEFIYNNSYHTNIKMAPYETLYGKMQNFGLVTCVSEGVTDERCDEVRQKGKVNTEIH